MQEITCPAGQWTVLTKSNAAGMPANYMVSLSGDTIAGEYRIFRGFLPFGIGQSMSQKGELKAKMEFNRGWFDASFRVEICPKDDLIAKL